MSKIFAAAFLVTTAFLSAAFSQKTFSSSTGQIGGSGFVRAPISNPISTSSENIAATEKEAFDLINKQRADAGLSALIWREDLANLARVHSRDMAEQKYFSHRGSDGSMVDERADKLGIRSWSAIGENIAFLRGFDDAASFAVGRWMESTAHRQNLLDKRWKESGIGVAILPDGTYYLTQVFLLRD